MFADHDLVACLERIAQNWGDPAISNTDWRQTKLDWIEANAEAVVAALPAIKDRWPRFWMYVRGYLSGRSRSVKDPIPLSLEAQEYVRWPREES